MSMHEYYDRIFLRSMLGILNLHEVTQKTDE